MVTLKLSSLHDYNNIPVLLKMKVIMIFAKVAISERLLLQELLHNILLLLSSLDKLRVASLDFFKAISH